MQFTPADFLKRLQEVDALIAKEQEGEFEFAHLSFQEYLAAVEIKATHQEACLLEVFDDAEKLAWWAETMKLYAAQGDATRLIEAALADPTLEKLLLAIDFWQGAVTVDAPVQTALLEKLHEPLQGLEGDDLAYAKEITPRYFKLAFYLQTQQWQAADQETYLVMKAVGDREQKGYLYLEDLRQFPCADLRVIDQLWVRYSNGRFGFSVQKQIWVEVGGKLDFGKDRDAAITAFEKMSDRIGWRVNGKYLGYSQVTFGTSAPPAHLPASPIHLPFILGALVGGGVVSFLASRLVNCSR